MKIVLNLLLPIIVVLAIYFGSQIWMNNYDIRNLKTYASSAIVNTVKLRPEGMYETQRVIGNRLQTYKTHMPKHSLLNISFEGYNKDITILLKQNFVKGQEIKICRLAGANGRCIQLNK